MSRIEQLEELLCDLGFGVPHGAIRPVSGYWRKQDVFRWEAQLIFEGREVAVCSWDTVTDCVRFGIECHRDGAFAFEICRRTSV